MKRLLKVLLGFNAACLGHLAAGEPKRFLRACLRSFASTRVATRAIPDISLGEILQERRPTVRLSVMRYEDGSLPSEQAMALLAILVAESPSEILEIGTYMGHTTRLMAENLEEAMVHTVDLPPDFLTQTESEHCPPKDDFHLISRRIVGREFRDRPCAKRIRQHLADTANWDFSEAGRPTFFFIDGSHTYEYAKNDSERCLKLCGGKGVFLWHDCDDSHPGVVRFLSEWREQGRDVRLIEGTPIAYWKGGV